MSLRVSFFLSAPFAAPAGIVLGLALAPAAAFLWFTARPAAGLGGGFVAWAYALLFTVVLGASVAWPILVIYLLPL